MSSELTDKIKEFIEQEARSCSMDFGCITPEYVYRMWGGRVELEDIENGLREARKLPGSRNTICWSEWA